MHALDDGPPIALDLCVSDSGTGKVSPNYKTGAKCVAKGKTTSVGSSTHGLHMTAHMNPCVDSHTSTIWELAPYDYT